MPEMDGYQATREIRKREQGLRRIPIIAVTAHAMAGAAEECFAAGMDAYQSKPLDRDLLMQCLNKFLVDAPAAISSTPSKAATIISDTPIEWEKVEQATGGDNEFALELIDAFATSSKQSLVQIQTALAVNDIAAIQRAAHSLKGAAGSIGAMTSRLLAANLEDAAKNNNTAQAALLFEALRHEIARANEYLHDKLDAA